MKRRIEWLDFAKGITIFFVVFGHSLSTIYNTKNISSLFFIPLISIIFTFIMPCFFAISGYLYKSINNINEYKKMIYKKITALGIPYVLFSIVYVIMQNFGGNSVNNPVGYQSLFKIYSTPIAYLWFLYALFFIFLIVGFLDLIHVNKYIQFFLYLLCTILYFTFTNYLCLGVQSIFSNILFFYVGYILSENIKKNNLNKMLKNKKIAFVLVILFILALIMQSFYSTDISNNSVKTINIFSKIISILLLFNISNIFPKNKFYNYFAKYGKFTLIIYLVHAPIMSILRVISFKLIPINDISAIFLSLLLVIIVWYISVFVCYLSKYFNFIYYIFYPLYKIKK